MESPNAENAAPEWWTVPQLARHWNTSERTIHRRIKEGKLPVMTKLGNPRIHISTIRQWEAEGMRSVPEQPPQVQQRRRRWAMMLNVPDRFGAIKAEREQRLAKRAQKKSPPPLTPDP